MFTGKSRNRLLIICTICQRKLIIFSGKNRNSLRIKSICSNKIWHRAFLQGNSNGLIVLIQTISVVKAATNLKDRMQILRKMNIPARHLLLNGRGWRCEGIFSDHRSRGLLLRPLQLCYLTLFPLLFFPLTL